MEFWKVFTVFRRAHEFEDTKRSVLWNVFWGHWPKEWWSMWFFIQYFIVTFIVGTVSTLLFVIGGTIGLRQMFRRLSMHQSNVLDDGRVIGHVNANDISLQWIFLTEVRLAHLAFAAIFQMHFSVQGSDRQSQRILTPLF